MTDPSPTDATTSTADRSNSLAADPRTERTRAAVMDAGEILLRTKGPDGVTHAAVATAARVSRTTIYKHWPTRAKLLFEIMNRLEPHAPVQPSGDVRDDLLVMLGNLAVAMSDRDARRVFSSLLAQAQWDPEMGEVQAALKAMPLANISTIIAAAARAGQVRQGIDSLGAAGRLVGPLVFAALITGQDVAELDLESIIDDWLVSVRPI